MNNPSQAGQWISFAVAFALDKTRIQGVKPFLTNDYSLDPTINGGQPIDLTPYAGTGVQYTNTDGDKNLGNIRFRHTRDTQCNALMLDGHVQTFNYNKNTRTCDLLRKNVNVPPP